MINIGAAMLGPIGDIVGDVLKRVLPAEKMTESERENLATTVKLELMKAEDNKLKREMSAILMEAQSQDKWTSRARPSFMYVIYIMILISIPMGLLHVRYPETAKGIADGMQMWLAAIPNMLWGLFGAGYLGYSHSRSKDKITMLKR